MNHSKLNGLKQKSIFSHDSVGYLDGSATPCWANRVLGWLEVPKLTWLAADAGCWWEISGGDKPQYGSPPHELFQVAPWAPSKMATGIPRRSIPRDKSRGCSSLKVQSQKLYSITSLSLCSIRTEQVKGPAQSQREGK